jgi:hypothetical protein
MAGSNGSIGRSDGASSPAMIGSSTSAWSSSWESERSPVIGPQFDRVFAGEPLHMTDFKIGIDRKGRIEDAVFDFS